MSKKEMLSKEEFVQYFLNTEFNLDTPQEVRLDIMGKFYQIIFASYQALREEEKEKYDKEHPTKGCDICFTPEEFLDILQVYKESFELHAWNSLPRAEEIRTTHNALYESACEGGVINEEDWSKL